MASPLCGGACVSSGFHVVQMIYRRLYTCMISPQCELPCASPSVPSVQMTCHRLHTLMALLLCEWVGVSWDYYVGQNTCCTVCTWKASHHCEFSCVTPSFWLYQLIFHTAHICAPSPRRCGSSWCRDFQGCFLESFTTKTGAWLQSQNNILGDYWSLSLFARHAFWSYRHLLHLPTPSTQVQPYL